MATNDQPPTKLTPAELRAMADEEEKANGGPDPVSKLERTAALTEKDAAPPSVSSLSAQPVMLSAADLKELLNLKQQFENLQKQLADQGKIAAGIGEPLCMCKGCHPDNVKQPGDEGYKEVKDPETGELLPYMATGQHAA